MGDMAHHRDTPGFRRISDEQPLAPSCSTDSSHCVCCSDEAGPGRVLALLPGGMAVVDFGGATEQVCVDLIESAPGDIVLVHAKVAIARLGGMS